MKVYIASPFFDDEQLELVKLIENMLTVNKIDFFSPRSEGILNDMSIEEKEKSLKKIFQSNVDNIDNCTMVIAVIDDWDTGTVWELGYAYGKEKPIFTFSNHDYGLNVMVRQSVLVHNTNINDLIFNIKEFLRGKPITVKTELTKDVT